MKKILLLVLLPFALYAQRVDILKTSLDSLEEEKIKVSNHLKLIELEIKSTNQKIWELEREGDKVITIKTLIATDIYDKNTWANKIGSIPKNTSLLGFEDEKNENSNKYYLVNYNGVSGIVFRQDVETIHQEKERLIKESILLKEQEEKKAALQKKYGKENGDRIFKQSIWLGMTKEMILESWGKPENVNKTVGEWGVHEQWIYGSTYLYIENGKLTSWQD